MVVRNFGASLDLGVTTAVRRSIALFHGANQAERVGIYARTAVVLQALQQGLIALGIVGYALRFADVQKAEASVSMPPRPSSCSWGRPPVSICQFIKALRSIRS